MINEQLQKNDSDEALWEIAKKRVGFKKHLVIYLLVNALLWIIWFFDGYKNVRSINTSTLPWPLWSMIGWGIGLALNYIGAYVSPRTNAVEIEYKKLKNK